MQVLVTGGTGFIGCHTVAALLAHGHQVRLLVRDRQRIPSALGPLGITRVDAAVGDVTNPATVEAAMRGCQAVVHAAAVYSWDPRRAAVMAHTNPTGTDIVLGTAHRHGLDPIMYVSSVGVFWPTTTARLTAGSPLGAGIGPYTRSKLAAEKVARGYQQAGAPVVVTYPAGVLGPHDPHLSDTVRVIRDLLRGRLPVLPRGRLPLVDVREVAALHAAVLRPGRGARRYLLAGPAVEMVDLAALLGELTGRRLPQTTAPEWLLRPPAAWSTGCRGCCRCGCRSAPRRWRRPSAPAPTCRWTTPPPARSLPSGGASCARPWPTPCAGWPRRGTSPPGRPAPWPARACHESPPAPPSRTRVG
jgi:dihydroflavonol-4-reductase